jgi:hypothetical protein
MREYTMSTLSLVIAILFAVVVVDRALLWCERRGWIYYRHSRRHGAGTALLNIEAFFQPSRQHVIELRQDAELVREEDDESGGAAGTAPPRG